MLHPIILAGTPLQSSPQGDGMVPMHFEDAPGLRSRFANVVRSLTGDVFAAATVVTTQALAEVARKQVQVGTGMRLIQEPEQHKPAAALLSAVLTLREHPQALVVVAPASADIDDPCLLDQALCHAIPAAQQGQIVMLGQRSSRAVPGSATLEVASMPRDNVPIRVDRILPSGRQTTLSHLLKGNHQLSGLGIYVARVDVLLAAFKDHAARLYLPVKNATDRAVATNDSLLLDPGAYRRAKPVSFEKAVAAKSKNIVAIQTDTAWHQLRAWDRDAARETRSVARGFADWDADLVEEAAAAQPYAAEMREVYQSFGAVDADQALASERKTFDWGIQEALAMGPGFSLQRLEIHPGAAVDLQAGPSTEHWIVIQGSALIGSGQNMRLVLDNQSARIPVGRSRRVENPGASALCMVQLRVAPSASQNPDTLSKVNRSSPAGVA
ncbi:glycosyltransferase family protein [Tritonibacter horizontis]|uniref:Alginate biosynthesis protein AlgA n=1 Tax=Tritonibacter horizontis TaxID=1768241 RepID=A0A132BXH4_9RHOB|nr:hypothetical protein [Tritonibacter horizontis]KUP92752.1 alginate biosynthesis protein AlgA [Tritonibacter horizontis]